MEVLAVKSGSPLAPQMLHLDSQLQKRIVCILVEPVDSRLNTDLEASSSSKA